MSWFSKPINSVSLSQRRRLVHQFLIFSYVSDGNSSHEFLERLGCDGGAYTISDRKILVSLCLSFSGILMLTVL